MSGAIHFSRGRAKFAYRTLARAPLRFPSVRPSPAPLPYSGAPRARSCRQSRSRPNSPDANWIVCGCGPGLRHTEVAREMGVRSGTVGALLARVHRKLRPSREKWMAPDMAEADAHFCWRVKPIHPDSKHGWLPGGPSSLRQGTVSQHLELCAECHAEIDRLGHALSAEAGGEQPAACECLFRGIAQGHPSMGECRRAIRAKPTKASSGGLPPRWRDTLANRPRARFSYPFPKRATTSCRRFSGWHYSWGERLRPGWSAISRTPGSCAPVTAL